MFTNVDICQCLVTVVAFYFDAPQLKRERYYSHQFKKQTFALSVQFLILLRDGGPADGCLEPVGSYAYCLIFSCHTLLHFIFLSLLFSAQNKHVFLKMNIKNWKVERCMLTE